MIEQLSSKKSQDLQTRIEELTIQKNEGYITVGEYATTLCFLAIELADEEDNDPTVIMVTCPKQDKAKDDLTTFLRSILIN